MGLTVWRSLDVLLMSSEDLCFRILHAESEREVDEIIALDHVLSDSGNWHPVDSRETNFNVVTNQASTGSKALTELCTNMVDAVLMKHAYLKGIQPNGPEAPQSVVEGVRDLVRLQGARNGILSQVDDPKYLQEFSEKNLVLGVTGGRRREDSLCFTFVDNGEGQHPNDFDDTFLSLSKGNKSAIPFVQGKYNMGSSGVLTYCGRHWYKLIVSRRYDGSGEWGWTLVRRRPGAGMPVAEYLKINNRIQSFAKSVIYPLKLKSGETDKKVHINTGTIIKLYDYQMESASSFRNIRESLNENLVSTVLPFRLMDYRVTPQRTGRRAQGVDERPVNGMEFLLLRRNGAAEDDDSEDDESYDPGDEQHVGNIEHPDLGHISVKVIVLGSNLPGWLSPPRNTHRVFHSVNGQVQFKQNRAYLSQRCKLPGLKDRIVVIVDSSDLSEAAHNDVWKGDRENTRATEIGQLYIDEITKLISGSEYLKELQRRIAREELEGVTEDSQVELFQNLLDTDPNVAQLLPSGSLVTLPGRIGRARGPSEPWEGKYSPTFLEVIGRRIRDNGADIAINGRRRIAFNTDVVNGYLARPENRGRVFVTGSMRDRFSYMPSLHDGRLTMVFEALSDKVNTGDEFRFSVGLLDDAMPEPVTEELKLTVVEERMTARPGSSRPPKGGTDPTREDGADESLDYPPQNGSPKTDV